jgi:RNA polymerase sigma-70 factor (ECF subfamily)
MSILKSSEEAENITQDVFFNLWVNREKIERESSVKYYIFTIAYNSAISIIRRKLKDAHFLDYLKSLQDLNQEPVNLQVEYNDLVERLNEIINNLPVRQREVYLLHKEEGLKYSEIAERLNISVNTIENHMSRALKTIREKIGNSSFLATLFFFLFI